MWRAACSARRRERLGGWVEEQVREAEGVGCRAVAADEEGSEVRGGEV